jgi:hypothetical protein
MKINFSKLQTGDTFFTRSFAPIGLSIQAITGFQKPTHVGKILVEDGKVYAVEMLADFDFDDNDLIKRPLAHYLSPWRFWVSIISIKRAKPYENKFVRDAAAREMNKQVAKKNKYDFKEIFAFIRRIFSKDAKDECKDLICSRFVYNIDKSVGVRFGDLKETFDKLVSPADLYDCVAYYDIPWELKHDKKNRFINSIS